MCSENIRVVSLMASCKIEGIFEWRGVLYGVAYLLRPAIQPGEMWS